MPAQFEVLEWDVPSQVSVNEEFTPTITVTNTGGEVGSMTEPLYSRIEGANWSEDGEWTFDDVPPGQTSTAKANGPWSFNYVGTYEFALGDHSLTASLRVLPEEIPYGSSFTSPDQITMTVNSPDFKSRYARQIGEREDIVEAPKGKTFLFINVTVENSSNQAQSLPHYTSWHYLANKREFEPKWDGYRDGRYKGGDVQPGVVREGYLYYEVPDSLNRQDPVIVWSEDYYYGRSTAFWGR